MVTFKLTVTFCGLLDAWESVIVIVPLYVPEFRPVVFAVTVCVFSAVSDTAVKGVTASQEASTDME